MAGVGLFSATVAIISSRLDNLMFYILASGSMFLAIAFSYHSFQAFSRRFQPDSEKGTISAAAPARSAQ